MKWRVFDPYYHPLNDSQGSSAHYVGHTKNLNHLDEKLHQYDIQQ